MHDDVPICRTSATQKNERVFGARETLCYGELGIVDLSKTLATTHRGSGSLPKLPT
jgi:hypothetical protein